VLSDDTATSSVIPCSDSTDRRLSGIDSEYMAFGNGRDSNAEHSRAFASNSESIVRAALYARVSTDRQREEATIESQLFELKRQISAAGHTLVKEYIDDGHSGAYLDRPALDELRAALSTARIASRVTRSTRT
jgi:predicted site-specific integrase-resolvase